MKKRRTKAYKVLLLSFILACLCWVGVLDRFAQISDIRCQIKQVTAQIRNYNSPSDSISYSFKGALSTPLTSPKSLIVDNGLE